MYNWKAPGPEFAQDFGLKIFKSIQKEFRRT